MAKWYAVIADRDDNDWGFGSHDLETAKRLLKDSEYEEGYIAVIENDVCVEELTQEQLFEEEHNTKIYTADRETGTFIDECESIEEAQNKIAEYEESDKADGTYEPDFYDIVDDNHMTIY